MSARKNRLDRTKSIVELKTEKNILETRLKEYLESEEYNSVSPSHKIMRNIGSLQGEIDFINYTIDEQKSKKSNTKPKIKKSLSDLYTEKRELNKQLIFATIAKTETGRFDKELLEKIQNRLNEIDIEIEET